VCNCFFKILEVLVADKKGYSKDGYSLFGLALILEYIPAERRYNYPILVLVSSYKNQYTVNCYGAKRRGWNNLSSRTFCGKNAKVNASKWAYTKKKYWKKLGHTLLDDWQFKPPKHGVEAEQHPATAPCQNAIEICSRSTSA